MCKEFVIYGFGFPLNKQPDPAAFCWPACVFLFLFFLFLLLVIILVSIFVSYPPLLSKPLLLLHRGPSYRSHGFDPRFPLQPGQSGMGTAFLCSAIPASHIV